MSALKQENWKLCVLCQSQNREKLVNPTSAGYETLSKQIKEFHEIGQLPFALHKSLLSRLCDLNNILSQNNAVWHTSCYIKINNTHLQRAQRRNGENAKPNFQNDDDNNACCEFCLLPATKTQALHTGIKRKYHKKCDSEFRNKRKALETENSYNNMRKKAIETTFEILVTNIKNKHDREPNSTYTMEELVELHKNQMKGLGFDYTINTGVLKQKLLEKCPYLISYDRKGMSSVIAFKDDVNLTILATSTKNEKDILKEAAKHIRSELFNSYVADQGSVPASLLELITMIVFGTDTNSPDDRICVFMAELIKFHAIQFKKRGIFRRHDIDKETAAPVYLAAKLYSETRKKALINCTFSLGMSISYKRLQSILTEKANVVCKIYHREGVVCPPKMRKGIFTTAAVDNIDHNPSSTTATTSFHGTAITLMQHIMPGEVGLPRGTHNITTSRLLLQDNDEQIAASNKTVMPLPTHYSIVPACFIDLRNYACTRSETCTYEYGSSNPAEPMDEESEWLESTTHEEFLPWAAHHSAEGTGRLRHRTEISLLPVFTEQAHTTSMMVHTLDVVIKATTFLNDPQVTVLVADQPLYAILKQIQFTIPAKYGEDKVFVMMGGLHVEMAGLKVVGQLLKDSGWVEALVEANVTTQGRSESMLQASNISRTRYAHQVTAAVLYCLMKKAYQSECNENETDVPNKTFDQWRIEKSNQIPQFKFWATVLDLIIIVLRFIRAIRYGNFLTYLDTIAKILPWFFALDHVNYARWLSVHLKDLSNLTTSHPELLEHFMHGKFVAHKSNRKFSGMALDQAHEQMNAILKGDGGLIGLTENPDALLKWLLAGPELTEIVHSFEQDVLDLKEDKDEDANHTSDTTANKKKFIKDVRSLEKTIDKLGNPFMEESLELYNIESKMIAPSEVVTALYEMHKCGEEQYATFCNERLHSNSEKPLQDPIKLNKFPLLSTMKKTSMTKTKSKIEGLKNDCSLFSKLYIATCEHRTGDLDAFFAHENQASPPALSSEGKLRFGTKSDLLKCILSTCESPTVPSAPEVSAKILDGSAIVHMLSPDPNRCKTFGEYVDYVFLPFLCKELRTVSRLDVIWDTYNKDSLKNTTREKRGTGQRTRVTDGTKIPKGWANLLRVDDNKQELFHFISTKCNSYDFGCSKEVLFTDGPNVLTNVTRELKNLVPCNHEEADTRMMVHVSDVVNQGLTKIMIRTVDTDVVVLAIAQVQNLPQIEELWVHIGTGKYHQYLNCNKLASSLGPQKSRVLPLFHSFTGCDTVSCFNGKGKKSAFEAWQAFPALTEGLIQAYEGKIDEAIVTVEKYVVVMYDRSSLTSSVNECRKNLFTKKNRQLENIPPSRAALYQHYLRAIYQGVHVWGQMSAEQCLPCPSKWGWTKTDQNWHPKWSDLPVAAEACEEMVRCKCTKQCSTRCSCQKRQLRCSHLCLCSGTCYKQ